MQFPLENALIKTLTLEDFPEFLAFDELASYLKTETPEDHRPPRWTYEDYARCLRSGFPLGLFLEGMLIGICILHPKDQALFITQIAIHPNYRNLGLGSYLIQLAEKQAVLEGCERCTLTVDPFNSKALSLYFRFAYAITAFKKSYFGQNHPNTHRFWMEKKLKHPISFGEKSALIPVNDFSKIEEALERGYVGIQLISTHDPKSNSLLFKDVLGCN